MTAPDATTTPRGTPSWRVRWSNMDYYEARLTTEELAELLGVSAAEVDACDDAAVHRLGEGVLADEVANIEDETTIDDGPYREVELTRIAAPAPPAADAEPTGTPDASAEHGIEEHCPTCTGLGCPHVAPTVTVFFNVRRAHGPAQTADALLRAIQDRFTDVPGDSACIETGGARYLMEPVDDPGPDAPA